MHAMHNDGIIPFVLIILTSRKSCQLPERRRENPNGNFPFWSAFSMPETPWQETGDTYLYIFVIVRSCSTALQMKHADVRVFRRKIQAKHKLDAFIIKNIKAYKHLSSWKFLLLMDKQLKTVACCQFIISCDSFIVKWWGMLALLNSVSYWIFITSFHCHG